MGNWRVKSSPTWRWPSCDAIAAGLSPEEARREARRSFGGIEQMKEDHRDQRSVRWVENLWRDVRYGMASLARDPGFAAVTIGLLALGIGANTAMFSIVDAVLLKPLPFPEPERMVRLWETPSRRAATAPPRLRFSTGSGRAISSRRCR